MSKKKRRFEKHRPTQPTRPMRSYDNHHLCFIKARWCRGPIKELRQFHYCIVPLPKSTLHKFIHQNMANVPVPREISARQALEQLRMLEKANAIHDYDPIEKRLALLASLFDCIEQPTADGFRKQLELVRFYKIPP